jgi:hypothetical protein
MLFNPGKISSPQTQIRIATLLHFARVTLGGQIPPVLRGQFKRFFQII